MDYFTIKNWRIHQHYKKRNDPWIKLHTNLLTDYDFSTLSNDSKLLLVHIWLLASKLGVEEPRIPADLEWLCQQTNLVGEFNLQELVEKGFINMLSNDNNEIQNSITSSKINIKNINKINIKKIKSVGQSKDFGLLWDDYPRKEKRKTAEGHYNATVKTDQDRLDIRKALGNYKRHVFKERNNGHKDLAWQQGGTWFNNWKDYVEFKVEEEKTWAQKRREKNQ